MSCPFCLGALGALRTRRVKRHLSIVGDCTRGAGTRTPTVDLADPPDMAWNWFVSHDGELWMTGFRDEDFSKVIEETGVYRWHDVVGRISTTVGTGLANEIIFELLVRQK